MNKIASIRKERGCSLIEAKAIILGLSLDELDKQQEAIIEPLEKALNDT